MQASITYTKTHTWHSIQFLKSIIIYTKSAKCQMYVAERASSILDALKWSMMFIAKLGVDSLLRCPTGFEHKTCVIMIIIHSREQQLRVIASVILAKKNLTLRRSSARKALNRAFTSFHKVSIIIMSLPQFFSW